MAVSESATARISAVEKRLREQSKQISNAWDDALDAEWHAEIWRRSYLVLAIVAVILAGVWLFAVVRDVGVVRDLTGPAALSCLALFGVAVGANKFNSRKSARLCEESHFWRRWTEDASDYLAWLQAETRDDLDDKCWNGLRDDYDRGVKDVRRAIDASDEQLQETVRREAARAVSVIAATYKDLGLRQLGKKSDAKARASAEVG